MPNKIEFLARAFGKATKQAILNWRSFQETAMRVASTGKTESFVYGSPAGFVRVEITRWETRKSEKEDAK